MIDDLGPIPGACEPTLVGPAPTRTPARCILPPLDTCSPDDLLDLAANSLRVDEDLYVLCGSSRHVRALCGQIERLDSALTSLTTERDQTLGVVVQQQLELAEWRRYAAQLEQALANERGRLAREASMHRTTVERLVGKTAEVNRLTRGVYRVRTVRR